MRNAEQCWAIQSNPEQWWARLSTLIGKRLGEGQKRFLELPSGWSLAAKNGRMLISIYQIYHGCVYLSIMKGLNKINVQKKYCQMYWSQKGPPKECRFKPGVASTRLNKLSLPLAWYINVLYFHLVTGVKAITIAFRLEGGYWVLGFLWLHEVNHNSL